VEVRAEEERAGLGVERAHSVAECSVLTAAAWKPQAVRQRNRSKVILLLLRVSVAQLVAFQSFVPA
jgi:hypothetical protein